jgi:hypothetical protein
VRILTKNLSILGFFDGKFALLLSTCYSGIKMG